jgi:methylenetetrahydrofolate--tRNA-(uracil-5-)-methyltransferase
MQLKSNVARVIGGGLAGCEAAYQLAKAGIKVSLYEMKPHKRTPAQVSDHLAELVCSNSFRSNNPLNAVGLLKEEMRRAGGFLMACAEEAKVPAGDALAVDREHFAQVVESRLLAEPNIALVREELCELPNDDIATIVATGPLTSDGLAGHIVKVLGQDRLAFYDAIAPIVEADSIDMEHAFFESRWGKGEGSDYLNCPMNQEEYEVFLKALLESDQAHAKAFENLHYFEGCLPIEELASRGPQTLLFGPFKPVGLTNPKTGARAHAVLQLRKENIHGTAYNLVGCQTRLVQPAQKGVFGLIPALKDARFLRFGAIHRNTYLDAPNVLDDHMRLMTPSGQFHNVFFAGQITGVEGYVESMACGLMVSWMLQDTLAQKPPRIAPETTALGGLYRHTRGVLRADPKDRYVPSNVTWAMMPPAFEGKRKMGKEQKRQMLVERALSDLGKWLA